MSQTKHCSDCFSDQGLKLDAFTIGLKDPSTCPNCGSTSGAKLDTYRLTQLMHRFFVWGTLYRCEYGAAPALQINDRQRTSVVFQDSLSDDVRLLEGCLGLGVFHYGPHLWMVGEVEPLKSLQNAETRNDIISRIVNEYPNTILNKGELFYRVRKSVEKSEAPDQYDSPQREKAGTGRFDSPGFPVMYASQDLEICVHECRFSAKDELHVATLFPVHDLRLLDLTVLLTEVGVTEFESLDMAVHMLFLAGEHSYEIIRALAIEAHHAGYDGLIYPSYFSLLKTGAVPFETSFGISHRMLSQRHQDEKAKTISNLAIFGRPLEDRKVELRSINKLIISQVKYSFHFGPVGF